MHFAHLLPVKGRILICGPNWLGDSVMSMPAVQALRRVCPQGWFSVLVRAPLGELWRLHGAANEVIEYGGTPSGTLGAARSVRSRGMDVAVVFPNSFRSALIPYLARVPLRIGMQGHGRVWMLTNVVHASMSPECRHQAWEYLSIVGMADETVAPERPCIRVPDPLFQRMRIELGLAEGTPWVGLLPGAARGPSKQWPPEYFAEVGRRLTQEAGVRIVVLGSAKEAALCAQVAGGIGAGALDLGGRTSLGGMAAALSACRLAIGNDSGGMHLAAALGISVVAVFGITDPERTAPMGDGHRLLRGNATAVARDIPRTSAVATEVLRSIAPDRVVAAARELLRPPA